MPGSTTRAPYLLTTSWATRADGCVRRGEAAKGDTDRGRRGLAGRTPRARAGSVSELHVGASVPLGVVGTQPDLSRTPPGNPQVLCAGWSHSLPGTTFAAGAFDIRASVDSARTTSYVTPGMPVARRRVTAS